MAFTLTILSTLAVVLGMVASWPQLVRMVAKRSARGQSLLGWWLGAATNLAVGVVDLAKYHAVVLGCGAMLALVADLGAVVIIRRYRLSQPADHEHAHLLDMETGQLLVLHEAVVAEHTRRLHRRRRPVVHPVPRPHRPRARAQHLPDHGTAVAD